MKCKKPGRAKSLRSDEELTSLDFQLDNQGVNSGAEVTKLNRYEEAYDASVPSYTVDPTTGKDIYFVKWSDGSYGDFEGEDWVKKTIVPDLHHFDSNPEIDRIWAPSTSLINRTPPYMSVENIRVSYNYTAPITQPTVRNINSIWYYYDPPPGLGVVSASITQTFDALHPSTVIHTPDCATTIIL